MRNYIEAPLTLPGNKIENTGDACEVGRRAINITGQTESDLNFLALTKYKEISEAKSLLKAESRAVISWGKEKLRIDLSGRMPTEDGVHFLLEPDFNKIANIFGCEPNVSGFRMPSGEIFIKQQPKLVDTLSIVQHERLHGVSYQKPTAQQIINNRSKEILCSGYSRYISGEKHYGSFDEALTEMANLIIIREYWSQQPKLRELRIVDQRHIAYPGEILVVDELIKKISEKNGREYKDVFYELMKGKIKGKSRTLRILSDVVGKEGMDVIKKWKASPDVLLKTMTALKLGRGVIKFEQLRRGSEIRIMEEIIPGFYIKLR
ncbi:hypothetical protein KKD37_02645 [Patescibacteria group bacterium]|nr:hypothetical protein [Patescibacteria group bacterium]